MFASAATLQVPNFLIRSPLSHGKAFGQFHTTSYYISDIGFCNNIARFQCDMFRYSFRENIEDFCSFWIVWAQVSDIFHENPLVVLSPELLSHGLAILPR